MRLISAITRVRVRSCSSTKAAKKFRGGLARSDASITIFTGVTSFAFSTSTRLWAMIFSSVGVAGGMKGQVYSATRLGVIRLLLIACVLIGTHTEAAAGQTALDTPSAVDGVIAAEDDANNAEVSTDSAAKPQPLARTLTYEQQLLAYLVGAAILLPISCLGALLFFWLGWYRLDRAPPQSRAFAPAVGIGLFIAAWALSFVGLLGAQALFGIDTSQALELDDFVLLGLGRYVAEGLIVVVFAYLLLRARQTERALAMASLRAVALGIGAIGLFWIFALTATLVVSLIMHLFRLAPEQIAHVLLAQLVESERDLWFYAMAVMVIVVAPIVEEVLYRGILQNVIGRVTASRWLGIICASAIFAIMHIAAAPSVESLPGMLMSLFVVAVGFGWAYEKSGRLIVPITMHMLFNAGNLGIGMLVP